MIVPTNLKAAIYREDILGQIIVPVCNRFTYLIFQSTISCVKAKHLQDSVKEELQKQQQQEENLVLQTLAMQWKDCF